MNNPTKDRIAELRSIAASHIQDNLISWDYSNWDGLICEEEITEEEFEWMEGNFSVFISVTDKTGTSP